MGRINAELAVLSLGILELEELGDAADEVSEMLADPEIQAQIQDFLGDDPCQVVIHQTTHSKKTG